MIISCNTFLDVSIRIGSLASLTCKPDIVIIDKQKKYQHFASDIQCYSANVRAFAIGSNTGFINSENKLNLHKFVKQDIQLKCFKKNNLSIAILSRYYIFIWRNSENWNSPEHILAPLPNP